MSNIYSYKGKKIVINRFPKSSNKSLRSWNTGDELTLSYIEENNLKNCSIGLYNDRFGFFSCIFKKNNPSIVVDYKSQEKAIHLNFKENNIEFSYDDFLSPLSPLKEKKDLVLVKIPKSLDLFQLHLQHINEQLTESGIVICSFMTKHFSKKMIEIAEIYFDEIEQTKAWKKARLLILKSPKEGVKKDIIKNVLLDENEELKQYLGVFSANHIDYATQFLIKNLQINLNTEVALDLASGNGVLAHHLRKQNSNLELHLVDDMSLAIESSKLNLTNENTYFHYNNSLEEFQNNFFDLIVCNPPFHFEHETNIEISLTLFKEAKRCLNKNGVFQLVANKHLNYQTHLVKLFETVEVIKENEKFIIYKCSK